MAEKPDHGMHYIWDYERNTGICWCGEDHADDSGNHGPIPEDQWIDASDPRVPALLDEMYAEAWLAPVTRLPDTPLTPRETWRDSDTGPPAPGEGDDLPNPEKEGLGC